MMRPSPEFLRKPKIHCHSKKGEFLELVEKSFVADPSSHHAFRPGNQGPKRGGNQRLPYSV